MDVAVKILSSWMCCCAVGNSQGAEIFTQQPSSMVNPIALWRVFESVIYELCCAAYG
jgi:hypothetical protein